MGFLSFIVLLAIAYLVWRVTDQLPDLIFRLSEIQRDVADIRRRLADQPEQRPDSDVVAGPSTTTGPVHGGETGAGYTET
jgi:hypothetical protein